MKYYYTDPIKAAWMTQNFNIGYININTWDDSYSIGAYDFISNVIIPESSMGFACAPFEGTLTDKKFYIHPDCYEMFKPQVGDFIKETRSGVFSEVWNVHHRDSINLKYSTFIEKNKFESIHNIQLGTPDGYKPLGVEFYHNKSMNIYTFPKVDMGVSRCLSSEIEIIQRNDNQFFMPECEE